MATEEKGAKPRFKLPSLLSNPNGWGPISESTNVAAAASANVDDPTAPVAVAPPADIPFQLYNKADKLGRISDWNANYQHRDGASRFGSSAASGAASAFNWKADEDENSFSLVDNKPKKPAFGFRPSRGGWSGQSSRGGSSRGGGAWGQSQGSRRGGAGGSSSGSRGGRGGFSGFSARGRGGFSSRGARGGRGGRSSRFSQPWQQPEVKDASIAVNEEWKLMEDIELPSLNKLTYEYKIEAEDLVTAGELETFNRKYDRVDPKAPEKLKPVARQFFTTTTSDDPILADLAKEQKGNVFATSTILGVLMCAPRSVTSWDIIVKKQGGNIWFDKRPASRIDFLTVNENWNDQFAVEKDSINHAGQLAVEATYIQQNFSQQVLDKAPNAAKHKFEKPHPFAEEVAEESELASSGYRYRSFKLDDETTVVARCELNAYQLGKDGKPQLLTISTLNEFDPKLTGSVNWRTQLSLQMGAVFATEMKNNYNMMSRVGVEALLAGADAMKCGFVSRASPKDHQHHLILKVHTFKPDVYAKQIQLDENNIWAILKTIVDKIKSFEDGMYVLLKDPNKATLHIYSAAPETLMLDDGTLEEEPAQAS